MNRLVPGKVAVEIINKIVKEYPHRYDYPKHRITIMDENENDLINFRLPILIGRNDGKFETDGGSVNYVILLVQSGNCAVGYFENGKNLNHKVFRSYMVRKKQGVSQIKYLKTKGKSRAGSRVRLGETDEFFQNIIERLNSYFNQYEIQRVALSCSKILIPFLFNGKNKAPFEKNDERIYNIPIHVHTPVYEVMMEVNKYLLRGEFIYEEQHQGFIEELLENRDEF